MIKIIKNGELPKKKMKWIYTVTCRNCGCVFECSSKDLDWRNRGFFDSAKYTVGGIKCPYCKEEIVVSGDTPYRKEVDDDQG